MPKLTRKDILHVAELARLSIPEGEIDSRLAQFNQIIEYVEKLETLKTEGIVPTTQVSTSEIDAGTPLAIDEPHASLSLEDVIKNAPDRQDFLFKVPRMIGEEPT